MKNQTALVTGASGFLGGHVVKSLLEAGYKVRGSLRSMRRASDISNTMTNLGLDTSNLSFVELDLTSDQGWKEAMQNIDVLVHTASPFITHVPKDADELIVPAVEGTRRAIGAALACNVPRIILTSSIASVAYGLKENPSEPLTDESWSATEGYNVTPYTNSKTLAEQLAWKMVADEDKKEILTVINPGFILGPLLDSDSGTSGDVIRKMFSGQFPGSPDIYFTVVDVRDVASVHTNAISDDASRGKRLLIGSKSLSLGEIADELASEFPQYKKKLPTRRLPGLMVRLVGLFDADAAATVRSLGHRYEVDASLAFKVLGKDPIDYKTAIKEMGHSIVNGGFLD